MSAAVHIALEVMSNEGLAVDACAVLSKVAAEHDAGTTDQAFDRVEINFSRMGRSGFAVQVAVDQTDLRFNEERFTGEAVTGFDTEDIAHLINVTVVGHTGRGGKVEFCGIVARCCEGKSFCLVCWNDTENLRWFRFISNAENLTGPQIAQLYRDRWKIELFFKKLKQNLRVQSFIGRSPNAVMNQIWGAMISVLLVDVLLRQAKYPWSFSRLFDYLSMNLLTHNNLTQIIERPNLPTEPNEASLEGVQQRLFD